MGSDPTLSMDAWFGDLNLVLSLAKKVNCICRYLLNKNTDTDSEIYNWTIHDERTNRYKE